MNSKILRNSVVVALLCAVAAVAATKGDGSPFAKYGVSQIAGYDAGVGAPICISANGQNTVMVRNRPRDGGSAVDMYCGFDTSVSPTTGMPVLALESLSVDVVAVAPVSYTPPASIDGGVVQGATTAAPQLCCIEAAGGAISDLHWMIVK